MDAKPKTLIGVREAIALAVWLCAAAVVALVAAGGAAPRAAQETAEAVLGVLGKAALGAAGVGAVALVLWPPAVPWIRLQLRRLRDRMTVDQGPMIEALGRLKHFETAPDHVAVGRTLLRMGQPARAIPHLLRAVEIEPEQAQNAFLAGVALFEVGALPQARQALEHAVAIDPAHGFGDALLTLGRALARLGEDEKAAAVLARHEERFGPSPRADLVRGRLLARLGQPERARELLDRAALPPKDRGLQSAEDRLARAQAKVARHRVGGTR